MTDFEIHPIGTADLIERLRDEYVAASRTEAADRIEQLEAALTRANAATAAAYEVAAQMVQSTAYTSNGDGRSLEPVSAGLVGMDMHHATISDAIRALATPDQTAALDKLIAEAETRGMERAAIIANKLLVRSKFGSDTLTEVVYNDFVGAAILAASKKGGV